MTQQQNSVCGNLQPLFTINYNHTETTVPLPTRNPQKQGGPSPPSILGNHRPKTSRIIWFTPKWKATQPVLHEGHKMQLTTSLQQFFFYIQSKKLQHILLNYTTYKKLYSTTNTIPFGAKNYDYRMVTSNKTENSNIALHVTTRRREWKEM